MTFPTDEAVREALGTVLDPEIRRPITELDMVRSVDITEHHVDVGIALTTAGCPLRGTIAGSIEQAVGRVEGVESVSVEFGVMTDEERRALQTKLRGGVPEAVIPFSQPGSLTRVYAIASGKGGVGKSSVTANLAVTMAQSGLRVGVVDADIYGHSIPGMLGITQPPTRVEDMIMPPVSQGVKVISIGMFTQGNTPVVWRGPMMHRALQQFLADVYWGDLDVLLLDLPPGTGDVAISVAQLLPGSEIVVITTPQAAAAEVAERSGAMAAQTNQKVVGVVENMSYLELPDGEKMDLFGSGGGQKVADQLSEILGYRVPLIGQIPLEQQLREAGDAGSPLAGQEGNSTAQQVLRSIANSLSHRSRGLSGKSLNLTPVNR
ncbi:MAG: Mrp/NBP35 family ATP-binding protein [Flaviflexus sp.]|nr:Mrp/NBP35 family ATP-binding protein [Flaviflexus sp.]